MTATGKASCYAWDRIHLVAIISSLFSARCCQRCGLTRADSLWLIDPEMITTMTLANLCGSLGAAMGVNQDVTALRQSVTNILEGLILEIGGPKKLTFESLESNLNSDMTFLYILCNHTNKHKHTRRVCLSSQACNGWTSAGSIVKYLCTYVI